MATCSEPLSGYLSLIEKLYEEPQTYASGWNFGPNETDVKSVEWIVKYEVNFGLILHGKLMKKINFMKRNF